MLSVLLHTEVLVAACAWDSGLRCMDGYKGAVSKGRPTDETQYSVPEVVVHGMPEVVVL